MKLLLLIIALAWTMSGSACEPLNKPAESTAGFLD